MFAYNIPRYNDALYFGGSGSLDSIPGHVYVAADGRCGYGTTRSEILNPAASGSWSLTVDTDGDNIPDSAHGELYGRGVGQYNGFNPLHLGGGNCLFADGHGRLVPIADWARNVGELWGDGDVRAYR